MKSSVIMGATAGALLLAASPAHAKDEFETAFKYELGSIAAHEAAHAGRHLLGAALIGPWLHGHYVHRSGGHYYSYRHPYRHYRRPFFRHHHQYRHHRPQRHHRHRRGCDCSGRRGRRH